MENSIRDRVSEVLKYLGLNVNRASKYLGVPQRTLNRQVNEGGNISMETRGTATKFANTL